MVLLLLGIALFAGVHFIPSLAPSLKAGWLRRMGEGGYKGGFSLLLLASFALMIAGWRSAGTDLVYRPLPALYQPALGLLAIAFLLMVVSSRNSRIRRLVRHPQLTGVALWGVAHLLMNGDSRALLLFGGMTTWALVEIIAINRREGAWIKDQSPAWGAEIVTLAIAAVVLAFVAYIHPWISGVRIL